ncbi:MAG: Flp family type IVb pilin [Planctomycetota bacterium]
MRDRSMKRIVQSIRSLTRDESGVSAVEYAMLLALIVMACVVSAGAIGDAAHGAMWDVVETLE